MTAADPGAARVAAPDSVFEGTVLKMGRTSVSLLVEGVTRELWLAPETTLWRGSQTEPSEIQLGDRLLVRLQEGLVIERAWANLARELGAVRDFQPPHMTIRRRGSGVNVLLPESFERDVVHLSEAGSSGFELDALTSGSFIDVIGLRTASGTISASKISLLEASPAHALPLPELPSLPVSQSFTGVATWFECPGGKGKCGTCATSESNQAAWPHTALSDGSSPCDRTSGCKNQPLLRCGDSFVLTPCNGIPVTLIVVDCGPCQNGTNCRPVLCSRACNFPSGCSGTGVVVDLTKPTFARFFDPAEIGCFVATVTV